MAWPDYDNSFRNYRPIRRRRGTNPPVMHLNELVHPGNPTMISETVSILVVEDEGLIRLSLVEDLEDAGFVVFEAGNADGALKILNSHPEIEAIFTDIDMPGSMDGLDLAKFVRQSRPEVAILLTSGYLKIPRNDLPGKIPFFSKPYEVDRIVNHIRKLTIGRRRKVCFAAAFAP